jgi:kynureninase
MSEQRARELDAAEPGWRDQFAIPPWPGGREPDMAYFAGNSLGLQPLGVQQAVDQELADWRELAVEAHLEGRRPWLAYHELMRESSARLVGAVPGETVMMNTLTVNLHMMMATFYRPAGERTKILIEDSAFPSDSYAVASQAVHHRLDPGQTVLRIEPERVLETIEQEGERIALVLLGGVNYLTGRFMDIPAITAATHAAGAVAGWDLAHAAGNVPVRLHDWDVDFAVWCTYKYLNSGPGAVAGAFVHERHAANTELPRLAGWWGNDPATRFQMGPQFEARSGADGWQVSNPPILSLAPVYVSLEMFDRIGMDVLRERSLRLTGYLAELLGAADLAGAEVITPSDPQQRGCQLSLAVPGSATEVSERLRHEHGITADVRRPNVVRLAPVPLYSTFHDCWRAAAALEQVLGR